MLIALFFSTLFYKPATEPLCLDSDDKSTCISFVCPTCYALHGDSSCGDGKLPNPDEICRNYVPNSDAVKLGLYPIVTFPYSSITLYQVSYHIQ